jgi:hypothetical protein
MERNGPETRLAGLSSTERNTPEPLQDKGKTETTKETRKGRKSVHDGI